MLQSLESDVDGLSAGFTPFCCKLLGEPLISLMSQFPGLQNYDNTNLINL